jgi:hypothetical protein
MNALTPSFERETGQVILEGLPAGAAGEAPLVPVPGLELAFDRANGRLCRAVIDAAGTDGSIAVGEQAAAMLIRLFGPEAPSVVSGAAAWPGEGTGERSGAAPGTRALSPEPGLTAALSSLARLDAARATSPIPPGSPWWAAEAAELTECAGLHARARAEAHEALARLLPQLDSLRALPEPAVRAALAVAGIAERDKPQAAKQLREAIHAAIANRFGPRPTAPPVVPPLDVAAEVESLEKDRARLAGLQWVLDTNLVPEGLFRPGLSPYSDLVVRHEGAKGRVMVEALLAPGADGDELSRCLARLVDPSVRRVLAQASFVKAGPGPSAGGTRIRAELRLPFPLDEVHESWIEVVQDKHWPVRSVKGHRIRRALRWADAALRGERAPAGLAPQSTREDWAALAAAAWEQCRRDWEAAGDADRAGQAGRAARAARAARRQRARDPRTRVPQPPAGGPAYLAEVLGS